MLDPELERLAPAEEFLHDVLTRALEARGQADAIQYLRHVVKAVPVAIAAEGRYRRVRFVMFQRFSEYSARYNANTGAAVGWFFDALMTGLSNAKRDAECLKAAEYYATPPKDAKLTVAQYETQSSEPVFVARWEHEHNGIPVERDYIQVLVNGGTGLPFSLQRRWHDVDTASAER